MTASDRLESETRRADSAEAELRETAGELEKARATIRNWEDTMAKEIARNAEATALLERCRNGFDWSQSEYPEHNETGRMLGAFLSRAPAQPIMSTAEIVACIESLPRYAVPSQPAAPFPAQALEIATSSRFSGWPPFDRAPQPAAPIQYPCKHGGECYCVPLCETVEQPAAPASWDCIECAWRNPVRLNACQQCSSVKQPAAPIFREEWLARDMPEGERAVIDSYMAQPAAPEPSAELAAERAHRQYAERRLCRWVARAESAEAQLAAVKLEWRKVVALLDERCSELAEAKGNRDYYESRLKEAESQLAAVRSACLRVCPDGYSSVHISTAVLWPLLNAPITGVGGGK